MKSEHKLKQGNNNDLIKPVLYVLGKKLSKLVQTPFFYGKMWTSKKGKQPSFSFSIEKLILGCLDEKYSFNLSAWPGEKNISNISST